MNYIFFIFGAIIGSFLNVCIFRIPLKESIAYPPSNCPGCGERLKPIDLIPILSYVFLRGRCRYCNDKISLQYPFVELLTGGIFVLTYEQFGFDLLSLKYLIIFSLMIVITFIDLRHMIIPDRLVLLILLTGMSFDLLVPELTWKSYGFGFLTGGGFLFLIALLTNAMGGGDIKMMGALGFAIGLKATVVALFIAFITGAIAGVILLVFHIKDRKDIIPFGPSLCFGTLMAVLYGDVIANWYLSYYF